jgi:hypothetical protein
MKMKRILTIALIFMMALSLLTACGGANKPSGDSDSGEKVDLNNVADELVEDAIEHNSFSLAAAEAFWNKAAGVDVNAVTPDWDWVVNEERMATYGDSPDSAYGHGSVLFEKKDGGEISVEEYRAWAEKVFAATAAASDDGHNIVGWEFAGDGEDALSEVSLESALEGWMQGWGFMKNGRNMVVYLGDAYDTEKDSAIGRELYYYGVSADIAFGMEKSMDETWQDMEDAFEEHEDEIRDALQDAAN